MSRPRPDGLSSLLALARRAVRGRPDERVKHAPPGFAARVVAARRRQRAVPTGSAPGLRLRLWGWGAGIAAATCLVAGVLRWTAPDPDLTADVAAEMVFDLFDAPRLAADPF